LLQSMAWTGMLANNLRTSSLSQAVERTFGGEHPCSLCKQISKGRQTEKKTEFKAELKKLECVLERRLIFLKAPQDFRLLPESCAASVGETWEPPVPPPRQFPA
ncbi:MAG: hypothetical protein H7Y43_02960, partial [Akkermansiaceae bacterium]|nr:hypothetical protein [Verrucomicrobiales bacterium]